MFFLKKRNGNCNNVDCDDFGWWLTGSKPDGISPACSTKSIISCGDPDDPNSFVIVQNSSAVVQNEKNHEYQGFEDPVYTKNGDEDSEEICFAEEPPCKTSSRSYTPERLIRTQDYTIITKSPIFSSTPQTEPSTPIATPCKQYSNKRNRCLCNLIDTKLVGASQLEALLDPDALDIKLPVAIAKRKIFKAHFLQKNTLNSSDLLAIANSESPRRSLTPDLISSGSSCERLSFEFNQCDSETVVEDDNLFRIKQCNRDLKNVFHNGVKSNEDFLSKKISIEHSWSPGYIPKTEQDPEIVVNQLRGRIDNIEDTNRDILGDLSSLKKNFQCEETKAANLTTETTRLRREIRDLRYLDDLVNLLRGELERISQRNWPFNLGHTDHHSEEVNLVV